MDLQQLKMDLESSKFENDTLNRTKSELLKTIDQLKKEIEEKNEQAVSEKKDLLAKLEKLTAKHKELMKKHTMGKLVMKIVEEKTRLEAEMSQPKMAFTTTSQGSQTKQIEERRRERKSTSKNSSTSSFVPLAVVKKCQKEMEQIKKSHAQETQRMKERYAELEKENQKFGKVFEGFKAMQGKRKRSVGGRSHMSRL